MKSITYKIALARAKAAARPGDATAIAESETGNKAARGYLRAAYTTAAEYDTLNPPPLPDEDGPCAGWGYDVDATLIY